MKRISRARFMLPNLFTVSSIFCGMYAIVEALGPSPDRFYRSAVAIVFAIIFDSLDGRVARITKTQSDFGVQLDSLADLISFGVAPAVLVYDWALVSFGWLGMVVAFVYVTCGALRLARFNIITTSPGGPASHFVGLPIPLAAAALVSLVMLHHHTGGGVLEYQPLMLGVVGLLAVLMVSNVPYRSFKKLRADRRTVPILTALTAGVGFAAYLTSFSLMFVVVTAGFISLGLAEALFHFVRRRLPGLLATVDREEDEEEKPKEERLA